MRDENKDDKIKHLEMVEHVIDRIASNSSKLKEWTMGLVTAICAFAAVGNDKRFLLIAFIPIVCFWILDSFYLSIERKYCKLYQCIVDNEGSVDFSLDTRKITEKNNCDCPICKICEIANAMFSISTLVFYLPICVVTGIVIWTVFKC